jgi:Concanavalin A-like lectin/glucanases superfamily
MAVRVDAGTDALQYATAAPASTALTVLGWALLAVDRNDWSEFFRMRNSSNGTVFHFGAHANGTTMQMASTGGTTTSAYSFTVGGWSRVAITINGTTGALYGADAAGTVVTATGTISGGGTAAAYALGGRGGGDITEWWNGRLANWKIYSAVLPPAEIEVGWSQYWPHRTADLWAWYPLITESGIADCSGNGRHLTAGSTAVTTEDGPPIPWCALRPRITLPAAAAPSAVVPGVHTASVAASALTASLSTAGLEAA